MQLYAIFGTRADSEEPVLLDCWDEIDIEENYEGYEEKLASFNADKDYSAVRTVILNVPMKAIRAAFKVPVVEATVKE